MKKTNLLILIIIFSYNNIFAQENSKSKFNIIAYGGIGYGNIQNDSEPNYDLNSDYGDLLLNFNISEKLGIAAGIGINKLTGNGFNSLGEFYQERNLLKIPLLLTLNEKINSQIEIIGNLGFYTQNIVKDQYRFLSSTTENIYEGWNYGGQLGIGFLFSFNEKVKFGMAFNGQTDFSKFKSQIINDNQKMKNLTTIGLMLSYNI